MVKNLIIRSTQDNALKCNCCDGEMTYYEVRGKGESHTTHIWSCTECPNVTFEYINNYDTQNVCDFLNNNYGVEVAKCKERQTIWFEEMVATLKTKLEEKEC